MRRTAASVVKRHDELRRRSEENTRRTCVEAERNLKSKHCLVRKTCDPRRTGRQNMVRFHNTRELEDSLGQEDLDEFLL
jgi:hypothetical protein